jgi:uridine phosphorylase
MYPILEYDPNPEALIEPKRILKPLADMPEHCVLCFFQSVISKVCENAQVIFRLGSEIGENPVYKIEVDGKPLAVAHPGVGGPLSGAFLDELIAVGCTKFVACGGAGVLRPDITLGHVLVPMTAIRDEGLSYHYLPPSREVAASVQAVAAIETTLQAHGVPYLQGKTWTTDAIYRETPAKIARRREEGCLTVEMEAASFFAVAQFRNVIFGQLLYGGDDVSGEIWDSRGWHRDASTREKLFWLAAESVLRL